MLKRSHSVAILFSVVFWYYVVFICVIASREIYGCDLRFTGLKMSPEQLVNFERDLNCISENGQWVLDTNNTQIPFKKRRICEGCGRYCTEDPPNPGQEYIWQAKPNYCTKKVVPFDPVKFCTMFEGQNIMIVGDSVQTEFGMTLTNMIYQASPNLQCSVCGFMCTVTNTIQCPNGQHFNLSMYRSDRLDMQPKDYSQWGANFHHRKWLHVLDEQNITMLIMNRGAHYENLFQVLTHLDALLIQIFQKHPKLTIIWRNSPNAVVDYEKQYNALPLSGPHLLNASHPNDLPHNWYLLQTQNLALREYFFENWHGMVHFLDVSTAMSHRLDSQVDYLHYRIPGLIDTWVTLLYNMLVLAKYHGEGCVV